ncbi:MAG: response regulator transcription factor [Lachnospiraceae bacterium]|nr:response regulator transcription factor [Lachnospiraceae bacterium]
MSTEQELRIAVCDDEKDDLAKIISMTKQILQDEKIIHSISVYDSASALLADIQNGTSYHILLLDVMMDGMNGMELAAELRKQHNNMTIIFISSNREMALCGYEVSAARYLAKPLDENKMKEALLYSYHNWQDKREILLPTSQSQHRILISDIQFVEALGRETKFVLENETVECKYKFNEIETMLRSQVFVLCHRSFIVNLSYVKQITRYAFLLTGGQHIPISKGRYLEIYKKFIDYISN